MTQLFNYKFNSGFLTSYMYLLVIASKLTDKNHFSLTQIKDTIYSFMHFHTHYHYVYNVHVYKVCLLYYFQEMLKLFTKAVVGYRNKLFPENNNYNNLAKDSKVLPFFPGLF